MALIFRERWHWLGGTVWRRALSPLRLLASMPATGAAEGAQARGIAFESFFRQYESIVFGYLFRMTGQEALTYDLSQETFIRAWQHFDTVRAYQQPKAWLLRVATNLALNQLQRQKTVARATVPLDEETNPASSDPTVRLAERDLVRQALLALIPRQRAALVLREVYGLPYAEVARMLGLAPAATRMLLWRARDQFRAHYLRLGGSRP
jgi:RNA polymerase sigma-70 factor (ECF subfamily)